MILQRRATVYVGAHERVPSPGVFEAGSREAPKPRLLDRMREALRLRRYSRRTEEAYIAWARRYILFHGKRPRGTGRSRGHWLSDLPGGRGPGRRVHPEPSSQRALVPLPRRPGDRSAVARRHRARPAPAAPAGRPDPRRGARGAPAARRRATPHGLPALRGGPARSSAVGFESRTWIWRQIRSSSAEVRATRTA